MESVTINLKCARRWRNYKALLANSERSVVNGTPVKMARQTFLESLYRFGTICHKDWSILEPGYMYIVVTETVFPEPISYARDGGPSGFGAWARHLRLRGRGYQREHDASDVQARDCI